MKHFHWGRVGLLLPAPVSVDSAVAQSNGPFPIPLDRCVSSCVKLPRWDPQISQLRGLFRNGQNYDATFSPDLIGVLLSAIPHVHAHGREREDRKVVDYVNSHRSRQGACRKANRTEDDSTHEQQKERANYHS